MRKAVLEPGRFGFGDTGDSVEGRYGEGYVEAFEKIPTAYSCIRMNSANLAAVPIAIEERASGGKWTRVEVDSKKFGDIAGVFERANPEEGKTSLWTRFHEFGETTGAGVLLTDYLAPPIPAGTKRPASQTPKEFWVLATHDITVKTARGRRVGYEYKVDGSVVELRPDEVLYHAYPNPLSPHYGVPPIRPAQVWAQIEDLVTAYMRRAMQKGNVSPFALKTPVISGIPQSLRDEQMAKLEADWKSKFVRGFLEKMVFLNHGMEPADLPKSFDSAGLIALANLSRDQIAQVFGVPPGLLGRDVTDHNIEEQLPIYWEGTLIPRLTLLAENLTEIVLPRFDPGGTLRARFDLDAVPSIQRMTEKRATAYVNLTGGPVLSPNEARRRMNLPDMVGGETLREAATTVPSGPPVSPTVRRKWIDTPERHARRKQAADDMGRFDEAAEADVARYFKAQEQRVLGKLDRAKARKAPDFEEIWREEIEIEQARTMLLRIYARTMTARGAAAMADIGAEDAFQIDDPRVSAWLEANAYIRGKVITGTTAELLRQAVATSDREGLSVTELAGLIRDVFTTRSDAHALSIARTETTTAYNFSTFEAWRQSGVVTAKAWLTAQDDVVRDSHREVDGDTRPLEEAFLVGGILIDYPGDPAGTAEETVNCRCTLDPIVEGEKALRRLVSGESLRKLFPARSLTNGKRGE